MRLFRIEYKFEGYLIPVLIEAYSEEQAIWWGICRLNKYFEEKFHKCLYGLLWDNTPIELTTDINLALRA
ncbi:MAG: hypothetical protein JWQ66_2913 [Mucilaginibacter sp.]|nr:hypothetical protein [Mucilaginibacter sp.]